MNDLRIAILPALSLALAACAAAPKSSTEAAATLAANAPIPQTAAAPAEDIAPEDRQAFFVHHARNGECDKVAADLDAGAQIDGFDKVDQTALIAALNHGHIACARVLLDRGANVNLADPAGWTPLIHAVYFGADDRLIMLLLDRGANINAQNHRGVTALYLAAGIGRESQVRLLLQRGADAGLATSSGYTALRIAQQKGLAEIVKLLEAPPAQPAGVAKTAGL